MLLRPFIFALCLPLGLAVAGCANTATSLANSPEVESEEAAPVVRARKSTVNIPKPRRHLATKPLDAETLERIAYRSLKAGNHDTAAIFFSRSLELAPTRKSARLGLGETLIATGRYSQALSLYRDLIVGDPDNRKIRHNLARSLIAMNRAKEGLWYLEKLIASNPSAALLNDAGVAQQLLGDAKKAQKYFQEAQAMAPGDMSSRNNLAISLALSGQRSGAERILYALVRQPHSLEAVRTNLAIVRATTGVKPHRRSRLTFLTDREPSGSVALAATAPPEEPVQIAQAEGQKPRRDIASMFAADRKKSPGGGNKQAGQRDQQEVRDRLMKGIARSIGEPAGPEPPTRTRVVPATPGPGGIVSSYAATNRAAKPAVARRTKSFGASPAASELKPAGWKRSSGRGYIVQLGAFEDRGNAEAAMHRMALKAPQMVGANPLIVEASESARMGLLFRVRTARSTDRPTADALCAEFKARSLRCFVGASR